MEFVYSKHWILKRKSRKDITNETFEYAITNSDELKDKYWENTSNAISRVPPSGRILKVVYKKIGKNKYKIITAYWLD